MDTPSPLHEACVQAIMMINDNNIEKQNWSQFLLEINEKTF